MSTFIVSDNHINAIVTWASMNGYGRPASLREMSAAGRMLKAENCKSVGARYNEDNGAELAAYRFDMDPKRRSPVEIIKACACLDYQSCEHDGWKDSDAKRYLDEVRGLATRRLAGYEEAAWEIID